jgi:hypothetical protein
MYGGSRWKPGRLSRKDGRIFFSQYDGVEVMDVPLSSDLSGTKQLVQIERSA